MLKANLILEIEKLLEIIPHLDDGDRQFWVKKMKTLTEKQLKLLQDFLQAEYVNAETAIKKSLQDDNPGSKAQELKEKLKELQKIIWREVEKEEKKIDERQIEKLIDEF